jgi:uncharacterized protein (TIGR03435 family)
MHMRLFTLLALTATALAQPAFDVASVKEVADFEPGPTSEKIVANPGNLAMHSIRLRACIKWAYDVRDYQISGPSWMGAPGRLGRDIARYEILAKAPADTSVAQMKVMLQKLLAERFKLVLRRETREMPVLIMTIARPDSGLKSAADQNARSRFFPGPDNSLQFLNTTVAEFAEVIAGPLQIPILDRTGLTGRFDCTLRNPRGPREDFSDMVTEAIRQQLGLKLEKQKAPIEMLFVDNAQQKPVEN